MRTTDTPPFGDAIRIFLIWALSLGITNQAAAQGGIDARSFVLEQIKNNRHVDLALYSDAPAERIIDVALFTEILNIAEEKAVTIKNATLQGDSKSNWLPLGNRILNSGPLTLEACRIQGELFISACSFSDIWLKNCSVEGNVWLGRDIEGNLRFSGSTLSKEIRGSHTRITGGLHLENASIAGAVQLAHADIGADVVANGARLSKTLDLSDATVGGGLYSSAATFEGGLDLTEAAVGKDVLLRGCSFGPPLILKQARIGKALDLRDSVLEDTEEAAWASLLRVAAREVMLDRMTIGENWSVTLSNIDVEQNVSLEKIRTRGETTLSVNGATVGDNLLLGQTVLCGHVDLVGAEVAGQLRMQGVQVLGGSSSLRMSQLRVGQELFLDRAVIDGAWEFAGSSVGSYVSARGLRCMYPAVLWGSDIRGDLDLSEGSFAAGVVLYHVTLTGDLILEDCVLRGGLIVGGGELSSLSVLRSVAQPGIAIGQTRIRGQLRVHDCRVVNDAEDVGVAELRSTTCATTVSPSREPPGAPWDGSLEGFSLIMNGSEVDRQVSLEDCSFERPVRFMSSTFRSSASFSGCSFLDSEESLGLLGCVARGAVSFSRCALEGTFIARSVELPDLVVVGSRFDAPQASMDLQGDFQGLLGITGCDFKGTLSLSSASIQRLHIGDPIRDVLGGAPEPTKIGRLEITHTSLLRDCTLLGLTTGSLEVQSVKALDRLRIANIRVDDQLSISGAEVETLQVGGLDLPGEPQSVFVRGLACETAIADSPAADPLDGYRAVLALLNAAKLSRKDYKFLEENLRDQGERALADRVLLDWKERERKTLTPLGGLLSRLFEATLLHGRSPHRILGPVLVFLALGALFFRRKAMCPSGEDPVDHPFDWKVRVLYSADALCPFPLGFEKHWRPRPGTCAWFWLPAQKLAGWALVSLLGAGLTGLIH